MTDDTRPRATATLDVDLEALAAEIGDDRLSLDEDGRTVVYTGDGNISQEALAAAVAAHVPPEPEPPALSADDRLDNLVAALASASTLADVRQAAAAARPRR